MEATEGDRTWFWQRPWWRTPTPTPTPTPPASQIRKLLENGDILKVISEFNVGSALSKVNSTMWDLGVDLKNTYRGPLPLRKGSVFVTESTMARIMGEFEFPESIQFDGKVLAIHLIVPRFPPGLRPKMLELYHRITSLPTLGGGIRSLDITLRREDVRGKDVGFILIHHILFTLWAVPLLEELKLELSGHKLGDYGCLRLLHSADHRQEVGNGKRSVLKKLYLGLRDNEIGPAGARYLAAFERPFSPNRQESWRALESLQIDLENNHIGNEGAEWMAEVLGNSGSLRSLHLNCKNNWIGDNGVDAFVGSLSPTVATDLRHLHLNLDGNRISISGLRRLENWNLGWLESMDVYARENPGCPDRSMHATDVGV